MPKYFSGVVCKPEADYCEWIFDIIQAESAFVFHQNSANHENYYKIDPDDYFILNYKRLLVAYGKVTGINERSDNEGWTKSVNVEEWIFFDTSNKEKGIDRYGIGKAQKGSKKDLIKELEEAYAKNIIEQIDVHRQKQAIAKTGEKMTAQIEELKSKPSLNTILYGPPGTGKTYTTLEKAVQCAEQTFHSEGNTVKENRDSYRKKYEELVKEGRIQFITFHQSFSYEDFIEGIKPVPPKPGSDDAMSYQVKDGILKRLAKLAMEKKAAANFEEAYQQFVADVSEVGTIPLKTPVHKKDFIVKINSKGSSVAIPQTGTATEMTLTQELIRDYIIDGVIRDWKPYTTAIGNYIRDKYNVRVETTDNTSKNYVLIIDEINRGNVSQIFGELITLIEEDKRADKEEMLEVTLPYSGEAFSVPPNLYLIGTMNTADRSVEALDTALRRRFSFIEMQSEEDHELIARDVKINDRLFDFSEILKRINARMEVLVGRDHKIGHSYFLQKPGWTWKDHLHIFTHKIIPLLQEYFYGDYSRICLVLGNGFVQLKSNFSNNNDLFAKLPKASRSEDQLSSLQEKEIWALADWKKPDEAAFADALDILMNVKQQNGAV